MCSCRQLRKSFGVQIRSFDRFSFNCYSVRCIFGCCFWYDSQFLYSHTLCQMSFYHRMNKAVIRGYEQDVGNQTTHHFMYPESAIDLSSGVHLVLLPFKLLDMEWLSSALSTGEIQMYVSAEHSLCSSVHLKLNKLFLFISHRTYTRVKRLVQADKYKVRFKLAKACKSLKKCIWGT